MNPFTRCPSGVPPRSPTRSPRGRRPHHRPPSGADADVIVVGAGPAGSTAAYHLAQAGLDVLLLEKTAFPREKVCGDGLTPRAVRQLVVMGIDISEEAGWLRNKGLRIIGGGIRLELTGRSSRSFPAYGLVRNRARLRRAAGPAGARRPARGCTSAPRSPARCSTSAPAASPASHGHVGRQGQAPRSPTARRWWSPPTATPAGSRSRWACTSARTARWAWRCARTTAPPARRRLAGVLAGAVGPAGPGEPAAARLRLDLRHRRRHVQRRPRHPQHRRGLREPDYEVLLGLAGPMPEDWGYREENMTGPIRGAALPMAFNRAAALHAAGCCWSATPAAWSTRSTARASPTPWSPGRIAADGHRPGAGPADARRENALQGYPQTSRQTYGGYYTLGRAVREAHRQPEGHEDRDPARPAHPVLMRFMLKMLANLTDPTGGDAMDRMITAMARLAPSV